MALALVLPLFDPWPLGARAATYYVDNQSPVASDTNPGTQALPYQTISAAATAHHGPGTVILVNPGVYRETVTVPASGDSAGPLVYRAATVGVVVDGSDDFSGASRWTVASGTTYLAAGVTWSPLQVFADGARVTPSSAGPSALPPNSFQYVAGAGLYVNLGGDNPGGRQTTVGRRLYGFRLANVSWVEVDGFAVSGNEDKAVYLSGASNCTVRNNAVALSRKYGIHVAGGTSNLIEKNRVFDHQFHGIGLLSGATNTTVQDNECYRNADPAVRVANGLFLSGANANLIRRNRLHDNQDSGVQLGALSGNNLEIQNVSWSNGDRGFDHLDSGNSVLIGCVAYGNATDGFAFDGASTGSQLYDCIGANNGLTTGRFDLWMSATAAPGFQSDYNLFWNSTSQAPFKFGASSYATVAAFSAVSGTDAHTLQADPGFVNAAAGDVHLLPGSPAIDAAYSGLAAWPLEDLDGLSRRDDALTPNTGAGPVTYADRGAHEYQPPLHAPTAALTVTPDAGTEPLAVTADASASSDLDGGIVSYRFDFGDGAVAGPQPGATAGHVFAAGTRTVTVTVTDDDGLAGTASRTVSVQPNLAPDGTIDSPAADLMIAAGQSVYFAGSGADPDHHLPLSFAWSFDAAVPVSNTEDPGLVIFSKPATYTVALTVTDALGRADPTPAMRVIVVNPTPIGVPVDEVHWTFTGPTSATLDWRGFDNAVRFGPTPAYGSTAQAMTPAPLPFSSPGPFWEARLDGLKENTLYHYSIGSGPDHTFHTPPPRGSAGFTVFAAGDIGCAADFSEVAPLQATIAAEHPAFVLMVGDLTYGNTTSQESVDLHYNDVMVWSQDAAYMPAWGNHEWEHPDRDDLRNYRGRFDLPHPQATPGSPGEGGEDWSWFDYGNVRFIAYPEPYDDNSWLDWRPKAAALMDQAQADPQIRFIVTFGHRPAYSSGLHAGDSHLQPHLDALGATHSKYVLNLNGHSHNYERSFPQYGVVHVTAGTGGAELEMLPGPCIWDGGCPPPAWSAFRAMHHVAVRLRFYSGGILGEAICGPPAPNNDVSCEEGSILDSFVIGTLHQAPVVAAPATAVVDEGGVLTVNVSANDPDGYAIASLAAAGLPAGATFTAAPGNSSGTLRWTPAFFQAGTFTVTFTAANALSGAATTRVTVRNVECAPVVTAPATAGGEEKRPIEFAASASDPDQEPIASLGASGLPPGAKFFVNASHTAGWFQWTPAIGQEGMYALSFTATNGRLGTASTTLSVRARGAPRVQAPATASVLAGSLLTVNVTASDPDREQILQLTASDLPSGATFVAGPRNATGTLTWTPTGEQLGSCNVTFTADNSQSSSATTRITVMASDRPPAVTASPTASVQAGATLDLVVSATDPDGDAIASFDATPVSPAAFATASGNRAGRLLWTPAAADTGSHPVTFTASNALSGGGTTTITVRPPNRPPVPALSLSTAAGNAPLTVTADASGSTDPDGGVASYRFDFGDGSIIGPGPYPTAIHTYVAPGNRTLTVTVADQQGAAATKSAPVTVGWLPGASNLVGNPSFETDISQWNAYSGATLLRVPGGFDGSWALQVTGPTPPSSFGCNDAPSWVTSVPAAGTHYRFAACVRSDAGFGTAKIQVREYLGTTKMGDTLSLGTVLSPAWQIMMVDYVSVAAGSSLDFQVLDYPLAPGEVFLTDNISIIDVASLVDVGSPPEPRTPLVAAVSPIPMRTASTLTFATSRPGPLLVLLFDLGGRRVRTVLDEANAPAGIHVATVDGKDDRGRRLGSGLYFYRIQALEGASSGRIVIAR